MPGQRKRRRATAVVKRDGMVLVVRDRGKHWYSLPGGGIERGETALAAAVRELCEETGLEALRAEFLFTHPSTVNNHQVVLVVVERNGRVRLQRKELDDFKWWNGRDRLPVLDYVRDILAKIR